MAEERGDAGGVEGGRGLRSADVHCAVGECQRGW